MIGRYGIYVLVIAGAFLSSCAMQYPQNAAEVRKEALADNFRTQMDSVVVNASLDTVVKRVVDKSKQCLNYQVTVTGGGTVIINYQPELKSVSRNKKTLLIRTRFRQRTTFTEDDDVSGYAFVADMEKVSNNKTKVTTYSAYLEPDDEFHEAIITSAQGKKGACPYEDL